MPVLEFQGLVLNDKEKKTHVHPNCLTFPNGASKTSYRFGKGRLGGLTDATQTMHTRSGPLLQAFRPAESWERSGQESQQLLDLASLAKNELVKSCKAVRARFELPLESRGSAWNCLEVVDCLLGYKGPKPLEFGGSLRRWQVQDLSSNSKNRTKIPALPDAKLVDQWLLVSEARSGSVAHAALDLEPGYLALRAKKLSGFGIQLFMINARISVMEDEKYHEWMQGLCDSRRLPLHLLMA